MWLHGGLLHIAFNMYALYIGGSYLEMIAGKGKYLAIYLVAGVAGNVAVYLLAAPDLGDHRRLHGHLRHLRRPVHLQPAQPRQRRGACPPEHGHA